MLATIERGGIPEQARITPVIPSETAKRDRERFINTAIRVLSTYPMLTLRDAYDRGAEIGFWEHAISIPTAGGEEVYPSFQFEADGDLHWQVKHASWYVKPGWRRAEWWTSPNDALDGNTPASVLRTERQHYELDEAIAALYPPDWERIVYEE